MVLGRKEGSWDPSEILETITHAAAYIVLKHLKYPGTPPRKGRVAQAVAKERHNGSGGAVACGYHLLDGIRSTARAGSLDDTTLAEVQTQARKSGIILDSIL